MLLNGFDTSNSFLYENGFYTLANDRRFGKFFAHYELYKRIVDLPGNIVECGIFKGNSFFRFAHFRNILETQHSRKIIGFDVFGDFPQTNFTDDKALREAFINEAGEAIGLDEMHKVLEYKNITNYELYKGDICETLPEFKAKNPQNKIAFLHIDTDIYEPCVSILDNLFSQMVRGGIIAFDDYGTFAGETKAVDDFFKDKNITIQKLSISHIPAFVVI
ncbi:MAG: TylF/MycF/NovP-related O-methyltransferase [Helicobacter sp.]|nr:macrocin O-methyltransferase [Helicobacteraceae bacterium]MDY3114174.1 TylF/MycF/NovP-related O-methyltransferase [Helicobacter sp.]